jgi:hypothetical protein
MPELLPDRARRFLGVAVLLLTAGCTTDGSSPIETPTLAPATTSAAGPSPTATPSKLTTGDGATTCTSGIRVIPGQVDAGAGHRFLVLRFNNVGQTTCTITGYPKIELVTESGKVVTHAQQTPRGQTGLPSGTTQPPVVTLPAGKSASAVVEASAVPEGDHPPCKDYDLMVTAPGLKEAVGAGPAQMPDCDLQVHPVVAGDTGGH